MSKTNAEFHSTAHPNSLKIFWSPKCIHVCYPSLDTDWCHAATRAKAGGNLSSLLQFTVKQMVLSLPWDQGCKETCALFESGSKHAEHFNNSYSQILQMLCLEFTLFLSPFIMKYCASYSGSLLSASEESLLTSTSSCMQPNTNSSCSGQRNSINPRQ